MKPFPKNCSELLSFLTQEVKTAPADRASEVVYQAGVLFVLSGFGQAAYEVLLRLISGELCLSKKSSLLHPFESVLFPSLCYGLDLPCPATHNREAMTEQELAEFILHKEQQSRFMLLLDRFSLDGIELPPEVVRFVPPPLLFPADWTEEYRQKMLGQGELPSRNKISSFLQNAYRVLQYLARENRLLEGIELVGFYEAVCEAWKLDGRDWISESVKTIAIDTCFRAGQNLQAKERLVKWWKTSRQGEVSLLYFPAITRAFLEGTLQTEINISQGEVNSFLAELNNRLYVPQPLPIPSVSDWQKFMTNWSDQIFSEASEADLENYSSYFTLEVAELNCSRQGASEEEILELEQKLKKSLPPSYKNFLLYSNGWTIVNEYCELFGTSDVDWFYLHNPDLVEAWLIGGLDEVSDEQYFQYGEHQDPCYMRGKYLKTALQISTLEDGYVYLLNPLVIDERGEWEAWDFGCKIPGAYRYRSFGEMMQAIYKRCFDNE